MKISNKALKYQNEQLLDEDFKQNNNKLSNQKSKKHQFKYKAQKDQLKPIYVTLLCFPLQFITLMIQSSIETSIVSISEFYQLPTNVIQWLSHSQNLGICLLGIISNKIFQRISAICFTIFIFGCFICSLLIKNLLVNYIIVNILFFLASISVALIFSGVVPFSNFYINNKVIGVTKTLSLTDSLAPLGNFIGSFLSAILDQYCDWRYNFLICGCLAFCYTILLFIFTDHQQINMKTQIDILSCFIIMSAIICTIVGSALLATFSDQKQFIIIPFVLIILSITLYIMFIMRNKKTSKEKQIFRSEVLNLNTLTFVGYFLIFQIGCTSDNFFVPIIWQQILKFTALKSGLLISLCKLCAFLLFRLYYFVVIKLVTTYTTRITSSIYILLYTCQIVQLFIKVTPITTEILNICTACTLTQTQVAIQSYNVIGSPSAFGYISSSIIGFIGRFASSIGLGISTTIQQVSKKIIKINNYKVDENLISIAFSYIFGAIIICFSLILAFKINILKYEQGRKGYNERKLDKGMTRTYDELRTTVSSCELVEAVSTNDETHSNQSILVIENNILKWEQEKI